MYTIRKRLACTFIGRSWESPHATLRAVGSALGAHRTLALPPPPRRWGGPTAGRPSADRQCDPLGLAHRRALARPPRALRTLDDGLRSLQSLASGWYLGPDRHVAARRVGRPWAD